MKRALSVVDLLSKKYKLFEFTDEWYDAFGHPERCGVWFIWGSSGNGKTSFVLKLVKYLSRFARVAYNSLEESSAHTMQSAFKRVGMEEVGNRVLLIEGESMDELSERLMKQRAPEILVIDSVQYAELNYRQYKAFKERHRDKLIILISHADGREPEGRSAKKIMFDATLKIWVEGYKARSKGRYIGPNGGEFTVWDEGASKYYGS